jgi:hypothetical protein
LVKDELLWAAAWLHRATADEYYLKYVVDNAVYMGGTGWAVKEFSWDNKYAGVQTLLSKVIWFLTGYKYLICCVVVLFNKTFRRSICRKIC